MIKSVELMQLEKRLTDFWKQLLLAIETEYSLLLRKGSLIDRANHYRLVSNYKLREELKKRLKLIKDTMRPVMKNDSYPGIIKCCFVLYLASEYWFIKFKFPQRIRKSETNSDNLSEGHFGSINFKPIYESQNITKE